MDTYIVQGRDCVFCPSCGDLVYKTELAYHLMPCKEEMLVNTIVYGNPGLTREIVLSLVN